MKVALVGAELEENLGLSYMAAALEINGHLAKIIPFNCQSDTSTAVSQILELSPELVGLSMVFTGRAREFCEFARALRTRGYKEQLDNGFFAIPIFSRKEAHFVPKHPMLYEINVVTVMLS
ncbi:MAG: hypothetical protein KAR44_07670 [Candidatus Aegiribacteria sp.]|nr:hypothetical protein [Candidatus Aegiribacteria sp.]